MDTAFTYDSYFHHIRYQDEVQLARMHTTGAIEAQKRARFHMAAERDHHLTPLEAAYAANALDEVRAR